MHVHFLIGLRNSGCKGFSTISNLTAQRCCYTFEGVSHFAYTFLTTGSRAIVQ
jgi:hypothetical protein